MSRHTTATVRTKQMPCDKCGCNVTVGSNKRKAPICRDCRARNMADSITQIANKSGPYFDAWVAGISRHASLYPRTTGTGSRIESTADEIVSRDD